MYLLGYIFMVSTVLLVEISAPPRKDDKDVCDGVPYNGMCYWTEPPPTGRNPKNCSGEELAWVSDNQTWQYITAHLDTEIRDYSRLNLGIYATPVIETQTNTAGWYTVYGERINWTHPNLDLHSNDNCAILSKDSLRDQDCDNGRPSICQSTNLTACQNKTFILNKCYWAIPELKENARSIYAKEKECVRLGGTLAVPESKIIVDSLLVAFPNDRYYLGMVNTLWYDLYTGQPVQNHYWTRDDDNDVCAVMYISNDWASNWRSKGCSLSFSSSSGLCGKDIQKGEDCVGDNTTNNIKKYKDKRCYWLSTSVKSMEAAKQLCQNSGGYLTYGKTEEEQIFLSQQMGSERVWIGITTNKRRWFNSKGEQSWVNWYNPYSIDNCITFSWYNNFKWSTSCAEPIIPGQTTTPKKGPRGGGSNEESTTGNLCMKVDLSFTSTQQVTTIEPTTVAQTTKQPTTEAETTSQATTEAETTSQPTTEAETASQPTTEAQTTSQPTTEAETTSQPTTEAETTSQPTTEAQTTSQPTTEAETTSQPTTGAETTSQPTTEAQTTSQPTTEAETTSQPTTEAETTSQPTTEAQTTSQPTSEAETTSQPTTEAETTSQPTTEAQTTSQPTTEAQTTSQPTTEAQTTSQPTTEAQTTLEPTFKPIGLTRPILNKDGKCNKLIIDTERKRSLSINCLCSCKRSKGHEQTLNEQTLEKFQEETKAKLILPQKSISAVINKKISVPDKRVSSTTIGTASVITIIGVLLTLVVADVFKILLEIKLRIRYMLKSNDGCTEK